jgi:hypothetical protein
MTEWMKERDLLVAETLDLLKTVAAKSNQAPAPELIEAPKTEPLKSVAATLPTFDRSEVKIRLVDFKATQLKFQMEREQYYAATMAKARATQGHIRTDWVTRSGN